jgi:hypothetical protein
MVSFQLSITTSWRVVQPVPVRLDQGVEPLDEPQRRAAEVGRDAVGPGARWLGAHSVPSQRASPRLPKGTDSGTARQGVV